MVSKRERTRTHLQSVALDLFESQGFDATTVAQIAERAGVTSMTFFRHFPSKAQALLEDPYDPVVAEAVGRQPRDLPVLARVAAGLRDAWGALPEPTGDVQRRRIRVVADSPSLWGEVHASNRATEELIVGQLLADGADRAAARAAAAAALAAITAAMFEWAASDDAPIGEVVERALAVLEGSDG